MRLTGFDIHIPTYFVKRKIKSFECAFFVYPVFRDMDSFFREMVDNPLSDERYRSQWIRISTFRNFPNTQVSSLHLAEAGFYYEGDRDEVVCYACGMRHRNWTSLDNPQEVHRRLSADCPHFQEANHNIPIGQTDEQQQNGDAIDMTEPSGIQSVTQIEESSNRVGDNYQGSGSIRTLASQSTTRRISTSLSYETVHRRTESSFLTVESLRSLNTRDTLSTSRHLDFITYQQRLRSFSDGQWAQLGRQQTPEQLAEAGFFFKGIDDVTTCFHCGSSLRSWEHGDDPYEEHARWSPDCSFLRRKKGIQFIKTIQQRHSGDLSDNRRNEIISPQGGLSRSTSLVLRIRKGDNVDLDDKVTKLETAIGKLTDDMDELRHRLMCKICLQEEISIVFLPCGHFVCCTACAARLASCPVCRKTIKGAIRAIIS